jgi:hypothetical protein
MNEMVGKLANVLNMRDIMFFSGLGMLCYGISMISSPAGWILGGALLLHKSY